MAKYDKFSVMERIGATRMVPVFYSKDIDTAENVAKACCDGGVRAFEFTNRGDFAHEIFAELMIYVREHCPGMALGAGTILDAPTAALYLQYGADFIVSPCFNPEVARLCNRRGVPYYPGCATVTEISAAQEAGCDLVKVFPGDVLGPEFVKDVLAPMPWTRMMVTGGVSPEKDNLEGWFGAGAFCVGMGSKLFPKDLVEKGDWAGISAKCREVLETIANL